MPKLSIDGKDYHTVFSTKAEKADNVYYHSDNKLVYVAHGETVSVLDAKTGEVKTRIETGGKTEEFRVDKKANKLFINLRSPSVVAVIDLGTNEVVDRFKLTKTETNGPLAYEVYRRAGNADVACVVASFAANRGQRTGGQETAATASSCRSCPSSSTT